VLELQLRGTQFSLETRRSVFLMSISVEFLLYYHCIYIGSEAPIGLDMDWILGVTNPYPIQTIQSMDNMDWIVTCTVVISKCLYHLHYNNSTMYYDSDDDEPVKLSIEQRL
jgi:hypothetical protein